MQSLLEGAKAPSVAPAAQASTAKPSLACLRRYPVPNKSDVTARCGTCEGCRALDRWLWSRRIAGEAGVCPISYWLTLTYGPEHLAKASPRDVREFCRRLRRGWYVREVQLAPNGELLTLARGNLVFRKARSKVERKALGKCPGDPDVSFLWRFELGEAAGRKHAHMLVHTHPDKLPPGVFPEAWPHGKVAVTIIDQDRAGGLGRYLSKYVGKSAGDGFKKHASVRYGLLTSGIKR